MPALPKACLWPIHSPPTPYSTHRVHTIPSPEPVPILARQQAPSSLLPPSLRAVWPSQPAAWMATVPGSPSPASATGGRAPQAPTYPFPEQSEAGAVDASAQPGQRFYAWLTRVGSSSRAGGTWLMAANSRPPPCVVRGCFADAVSSSAPTRSISSSNYPARWLDSCHLMGQIGPTGFSLSPCVRGHAA